MAVALIEQRAPYAGGLAGATPPAEVQEAGLAGATPPAEVQEAGLAGATPPAEVQEAGLLGGVWGAAPTKTAIRTARVNH